MGKTVIALRAIQIINPERCLIVAPRLVAWNTWPDEIEKWQEFSDLTYTIMHKKFKFDPTAKIHLVNPEGLKKIAPGAYDMIVLDESTLFKNWRSLRFRRALAIAKRCKYRIIMTGCPIPRDYMDLWAQMRIVDFGASLYPRIGQYRARYFNTVPKRINAATTVDTYEIREGAAALIQTAIAPRCVALNAEGLIEVPELVITDRVVRLDSDEQTQYDIFEKELFAEIDGRDLVSFSAGSKYVRCHQLANGACYDENRAVLELHTKKLEALADLVAELNGAPLLVAYRFEHDAARILTHIKKAVQYAPGVIEKWNARKIPILLAQYQTMAHGLNLQAGGRNLCCYSLTDNYDHYYQMICRLYRQGASGKTFVHRLVTKNTVDQMILTRLNRRQGVADSFVESLKAYRFMKEKRISPRDDLPLRGGA